MAAGLLVLLLAASASLAHAAAVFVAAAAPAPDTVMLDARGDTCAYTDAHLAGARLLPVEDWFRTYARSGIATAPWMRRLAALGVRPDTPVLLYDSGGYSFAAFARLLLVGFGVRDVRIVEGGWPALQRSLPASAFAGGAGPKHGVPLWRRHWDRHAAIPGLVDHATVLAQLDQPGHVLLDVRSADEYSGKAVGDNPRAGHLPGALNLPKAAFVQADGRVLDAGQVHAVLARAGIRPDQPLTVYCQGGGRSAFVATLLREAGLAQVKNYAGSWHEWSRLVELPIER